MKKDIAEYKLNFFLRIIKKAFLNRLSSTNINNYDRLPEKLKYDNEIITKVIELDKKKINNIPEIYVTGILESNPNIINELTDPKKTIAEINTNNELLRYVEGKEIEKELIDYYNKTIKDIIDFNDTVTLEEIINKNFPNIEYKIKALEIVANELNREENQQMDERFQYDEYYDEYIENETRSDIFYALFMNIYSQVPEKDMKSNIRMIEIWREVGDWKNDLEDGEYAWEKVKDDFYNIVKKTAGNDIEKRMELLQLYNKDFDGEQIGKYLNELTNDIDLENVPNSTLEKINEFKSNIIEKNFSKLNEYGEIIWAIENISDNKIKLQLLKKYCDLFGEDIHPETKSRMTVLVYEEYSKLKEDDRKLKLEMLDEYGDYIYEEYDPTDGDIAKGKEFTMFNVKYEIDKLISSYIKKEEQDEKVELLRKFSDRLYGAQISGVITSFSYEEYNEKNDEYYLISNDTLKKELLKEYEQKLWGTNIAIIISSIQDYTMQLQLLKEYEDRIDKLQIANIISSLNCGGSEKIKIVEQYKNRLADEKKYHDAYTDRNVDFSEILVKIIIKMNDNEKRENVNKYKNEMNQNDIMQLIMSINDKNMREQLFNEYGFKNLYNYSLTAKCFENFGIAPFSISNNMQVLSNEFVNIVGEDLAYSFVKYILDGDTDKIVPINIITNEPQLFKKYIDFREKFMQQGNLKTLELGKCIDEYDRNKELFAEFSKIESQDIQNSIMQAIISDGINNNIEGKYFDEEGNLIQLRNVLINNAEEIMQYPIKRKEYFENKINSDSRDIAYELILGMSEEEYDSLRNKFTGYTTNGKKAILSNIFEEIISKVPDESKENIEKIIAGMKLIEKYEETIDGDVRRKLLLACNEELSLQFENSGSSISKIRKSIPFIEDELRNYFGKELSESLYFLPSDASDVEIISGVEVIHMKGEDFQCLIHAVDAYGMGSGHYEKRESGKSYLCTSLISSKFMGRAEGKPIVAFSTIPSQSFIQEGPLDIGVHDIIGKNHFEYGASDIRYMPSQELLEETVINNVEHGVEYNEVDWYREYNKSEGGIGYLTPNAVICFNEVDEVSIEEAKHIQEEFDLEKPPKIRVIHEECYQDKIEEFKQQVLERYSQKKNVKDETVSEKVEKMLEEMLQYASPEITNNVLQKIIEVEQEKVNSMEEK